MSELWWCVICRAQRRFAVYEGKSGAPSFNCCQTCGDGYCITPEPEPEEEQAS
jgi:hypothetical protein